MPRVSDAHRAARREQIAEAALQVLARKGSDASIAEIVAECGLSAGAIYGNFENKADIARYIAGRLLHRKIGTLDEAVSDGAVRSPADVLRLFMSLRRQPSDLSVLLQFWGESTVDDGLHQIMEERAAEFRDAIARALRPWAEAQPEAADGGAEALARRSAEVCLAMVQGWFANTALFGWLTGEEFLDGAERAFRG
ncbi:DNA-binding transcriptional regulator, AcrR family [Microlunatus sagamiharensis]|uniref:DNA-binding transcriptional regulator, AcrR family n=1 Tax=Microlunatus sagamiharensis TaxID=546874 RepID=A0A1H2NBS0_9ACTN|nr:TetR/AcrR family transcriptional regulator [Microlunatus sagamiharensis]SDV02929.1 DNA-binding transcriptional regulator, AcrR family [Microlunatus sagamiharensis]